MTADQAKRLVAAIREEPLAEKPVRMLISLFCGLRLSEMLALTWNDYSNGSIGVAKSLAQDKQGHKPTKTGDTRDVPCPLPLISILEEWRELQRAWFENHGLAWGGESPVVNSRVGNHILQRTYIRWFDAARSRFGLPENFTFHGLRHTYVTLLNRDFHVDERTTRSISGHKSSQAFRNYTHTALEWQRRAASELGMLLTPRSRCGALYELLLLDGISCGCDTWGVLGERGVVDARRILRHEMRHGDLNAVTA